MGINETYNGELAEEIFQKVYETAFNLKITKITIPQGKYPELAEEKIKSLLIGHPDTEKVIRLLKEIKKKKDNNNHSYCLPDFIVYDNKNVMFYEIKSQKDKPRLSTTTEKEAIKILIDNKYQVFILNIRIFEVDNREETFKRDYMKLRGKTDLPESYPTTLGRTSVIKSDEWAYENSDYLRFNDLSVSFDRDISDCANI